MFAAALLLAMGGTARAGGQEGTFGVGAEYGLRLENNGLGFLSGNYDMGAFHVGGFLGLFDGGGDDDSEIIFGGRFYYHLHSTAMADLSIGGNVGIGLLPGMGMMAEDQTVVFIEPGIQIRAFVASNVALSFTAGFSLGLADADGFTLGGQTTGSAGVHYYFF